MDMATILPITMEHTITDMDFTTIITTIRGIMDMVTMAIVLILGDIKMVITTDITMVTTMAIGVDTIIITTTTIILFHQEQLIMVQDKGLVVMFQTVMFGLRNILVQEGRLTIKIAQSITQQEEQKHQHLVQP